LTLVLFKVGLGLGLGRSTTFSVGVGLPFMGSKLLTILSLEDATLASVGPGGKLDGFGLGTSGLGLVMIMLRTSVD